MSETRRLCGVPSERGFVFRGNSQGFLPGLVCDAPLGHSDANVVFDKRQRSRAIQLGHPAPGHHSPHPVT